jgi:hypothetical protein
MASSLLFATMSGLALDPSKPFVPWVWGYFDHSEVAWM